MKLCEWFRRYSREVCQRGTLLTAPLEIGSGRTIYSLVLILYLVALFNLPFFSLPHHRYALRSRLQFLRLLPSCNRRVRCHRGSGNPRPSLSSAHCQA